MTPTIHNTIKIDFGKEKQWHMYGASVMVKVGDKWFTGVKFTINKFISYMQKRASAHSQLAYLKWCYNTLATMAF